MNKLDLLVFLVFATMFAACSNDNVYEKGEGLVIQFKERCEFINFKQPWLYKYNVNDFSSKDGNSAGNSGKFYYYSSRNFHVGDTLVFITSASLKKMQINIERINILETKLLKANKLKESLNK